MFHCFHQARFWYLFFHFLYFQSVVCEKSKNLLEEKFLFLLINTSSGLGCSVCISLSYVNLKCSQRHLFLSLSIIVCTVFVLLSTFILFFMSNVELLQTFQFFSCFFISFCKFLFLTNPGYIDLVISSELLQLLWILIIFFVTCYVYISNVNNRNNKLIGYQSLITNKKM